MKKLRIAASQSKAINQQLTCLLAFRGAMKEREDLAFEQAESCKDDLRDLFSTIHRETTGLPNKTLHPIPPLFCSSTVFLIQ